MFMYSKDMDIDKLLKALDKEENEDLIDTTSTRIEEDLSLAVEELDLPEEMQESIMNKLSGYRYIEDIHQLSNGSYIRWINLQNPDNIVLTPGTILCEIKFTDAGTTLICKNFRHRYFQVLFDECMVFQRLSDQERILLSAIDYLAK